MLTVGRLRVLLRRYGDQAQVLVAVFRKCHGRVYEAEEDINDNHGHPQLNITLEEVASMPPGRAEGGET